MCKKTFSLLISLLILSTFIFSDQIITKYEKNPVFEPVQGQQVKNPCVLFDAEGFNSNEKQAVYRMWFATENGIALAFSKDGLSWTEYNYSQPLAGLQPNADLPYVIFDKDGFGGTKYYYKIWYWSGINDSINSIRTAESTDGILWENDRPISQHPINKSLQLIVDSNIYNRYFYHCYGPGSVQYNPNGANIGSATPVDKSDDQPMTYRYIMFYNSSSEGLSPEGSSIQTSLAYSADGIYWLRYGETPVTITYNNMENLDSEGFYNAHLVKSGEKYLMWFNSTVINHQPFSSDAIVLGRSLDGLNWNINKTTKLNLLDDSTSDNDLVSGFSILPVSKNEISKFNMWTAAPNKSGISIINKYEVDLSKHSRSLSSYWNGATVGYAPFDAHFEYQSTYADRVCNSAPEQLWHWDFGDSNSTEGNLLWGVNHTYNNPGVYTLSVAVGCYGHWYEDEQHEIYVKSPNSYDPCGGNKEIHVDRCVGSAPLPIIASVKREEMDGCLSYSSDTYWVWDFDDGTGDEGWDYWTVTHTYKQSGIYTITVNGFCDYDKHAFFDTQIINVNGISPHNSVEPCFNVQLDSGFAPSTIHFDTSCTQILGSVSIVLYLWDFGDGQQVSGSNPLINHVYSNPGRYTVTLQITLSTGETYSFSQIMTVKGLFAPSSITIERQENKSLFSVKAQNVLKWSANSLIFGCSVVKYNVYRKLSSQPDSNYQLIGSVNSGTFTFTDTAVDYKGRYTYVLTAVESEGHESGYSAPVSD